MQRQVDAQQRLVNAADERSRQLEEDARVARREKAKVEEKLVDADREKTEIAEHFGEALRLAQGGKVLPALPSAFLCRNCQKEIVSRVREEKKGVAMEEFARKGIPNQGLGPHVENYPNSSCVTGPGSSAAASEIQLSRKENS